MKTIKTVKYLDNRNDGVLITFEDETTFNIPTQKERYQYSDLLIEWLKEKANQIEAFKTEKELLKEAKQNKLNEINTACEESIVSGFTSSTLGSTHTYQSDRDDQSNLLGLNLANKDTLLKCNDGNTWGYKPHTASQIKDVFDAGVTHKETNLLKAHQLKLQVQSATTVEEIEGINW